VSPAPAAVVVAGQHHFVNLSAFTSRATTVPASCTVYIIGPVSGSPSATNVVLVVVVILVIIRFSLP